MASVHKKKRSPFWHAAFYLPDGGAPSGPAKQTNRTKAMEIAIAWSKASFLGSQQRLTDMQARRVIADIHAIATRDTLPMYTRRELPQGMDGRQSGYPGRKEPTGLPDGNGGLLSHLGTRAAAPLDTVTPKQVLAFRNAMLGKSVGVNRQQESVNPARRVDMGRAPVHCDGKPLQGRGAGDR